MPKTALLMPLLLACVAALPLACSNPPSEPLPSPTATPMPMVVASPGPTATPVPTPVPSPIYSPDSPARAVTAAGNWLYARGKAAALGDLAAAAAAYKLIVVDADPELADYTNAEIATLRAGGKTKVLSVVNCGSIETWRAYRSKAFGPVQPVDKLPDLILDPRAGRPDENWLNLANGAWIQILQEGVVPRLVARGVDGLYLTNLDQVEHLADAVDGPCNQACRQGGLEVIAGLRKSFPKLTIIVDGTTGDVVRLGTTFTGRPVRELIDGVSAHNLFAPDADPAAISALINWQTMGLKPAGQPFWVGTLEDVGGCESTAEASRRLAKAREFGFAPALVGPGGMPPAPCLWKL